MKKGKSAYKILVVSDSHGSDTGIRQAIKQEGEDIDVLVHCGDMGHDIKASLGLDYRFDIYSVTGMRSSILQNSMLITVESRIS